MSTGKLRSSLSRTARARLRTHPAYRWIALVTLLTGLFAVGFNFTVIAVVLPRMAEEFGTTLKTMQWAVSLPLLAFGVMSPTVGKLGDIYGAKRIYMIGFLGAIVMQAMTALAWSTSTLILFRVVAALEGAATGPAAVKFIATLFVPRDRPRPLAWWSTTAALGPTVGLVVGALVIPYIGWRGMFVIQIPLLVVALAAAWYVLDETEVRTDVRFDLSGAVILGAGLFFLLFGIERAADWGVGNLRTISWFATAVFLLGAFVWRQAKVRDPMFPLRYFGRRGFSVSLVASTLLNFAYLGGFVLAVPLMIEVLGLKDTQAGLVVIVRPLTFAAAAALAGGLISRQGTRRYAFVGSLLVALGLVALTAVDTGSAVWVAVLGLGVSGAGLGFSQPAFNITAVNSLDLEDQGVGGGISGSVQTIGASAGTVVLVSIQAGLAGRGTALSFAVAFGVGAAVAGVAAGLALLLARHVSASDVALTESAQGVPT
ncbi:MAG: MFS transporter [Acidimicrobiia bacterium]|nr:MFS transporter [Acidimicrobiia bacterium]